MIEAVSELKIIALNDNFNHETKRGAVEKVIRRFDDPYDIETLASLCLSISRHCMSPECVNRSDSKLRTTFETAYWKIVEKLVEKKDQNKHVLDAIKQNSQLDGADAGEWSRIVEGKTFP